MVPNSLWKSQSSRARSPNPGRARTRQPGRRSLLILERLEDRLAPAVHYYVSPTGNDNNTGLSPDQAWQTLGKVSGFTFNDPGSGGTIISLERPFVYPGQLRFDETDTTTTITLDAYGVGIGNPIVRPPAVSVMFCGPKLFVAGLCVSQRADFTVRDLIFDGSDGAGTGRVGILFVDPREQTSEPLSNVRLERVEAFGFALGIVLAFNPGFQTVRITDTHVRDNSLNGIFISGSFENSVQKFVRDVHLDDVQAYRNGNIGIFLLYVDDVGGVDGATIERSTAYENNGPLNSIGFYVFGSKNVVVQHNEAYGHDEEGDDQAGFGFDGCVDCKVQYNYSHGNGGPGYFIDGFGEGSGAPTSKVDVRYNISEDDARTLGFAGIYLGNIVSDVDVYNNTIFMSPGQDPPGSGFRAGVQVLELSFKDDVQARFLNNIIHTTGGVLLVDVTEQGTSYNVQFLSNDYYPDAGPFRISYLFAPGIPTIITSLEDWKTFTWGGSLLGDSLGLAVDPRLTAPGMGGTVFPNPLETLGAYRLRVDSPLGDAGFDLRTLGINPPRDFYGTTPIPQGPGFSIGAHEPVVGGGFYGGYGGYGEAMIPVGLEEVGGDFDCHEWLLAPTGKKRGRG